ncbi:hypothetical protein F4814DRAFT_430387 [Daldinia grandis]|nr:hypothetical protein F4814DRAFT_430387 [Daldinia grandis]
MFIQLFRNEELIHLDLSIFTCMICVAIVYCLYWTKPQSVEVPIEYPVVGSDALRLITHLDIRYPISFTGSSFLLRNYTLGPTVLYEE